ncbi:MAG: hypothetical protein IPG89_06665 [Bacteroidetes bacterium]|nr:hypothetical protein [Bacteroidota bacterium]
MRNNSEFYNVDWINGVVEVTIEVLVNGNYRDRKVRFNFDRNKYPWVFEGFVEGIRVFVPVPEKCEI